MVAFVIGDKTQFSLTYCVTLASAKRANSIRNKRMLCKMEIMKVGNFYWDLPHNSNRYSALMCSIETNGNDDNDLWVFLGAFRYLIRKINVTFYIFLVTTFHWSQRTTQGLVSSLFVYAYQFHNVWCRFHCFFAKYNNKMQHQQTIHPPPHERRFTAPFATLQELQQDLLLPQIYDYHLHASFFIGLCCVFVGLRPMSTNHQYLWHRLLNANAWRWRV